MPRRDWNLSGPADDLGLRIRGAYGRQSGTRPTLCCFLAAFSASKPRLSCRSVVPRVQILSGRFPDTVSHKDARLHAPSAPLSPYSSASSPASVLPPPIVPGSPSPLPSVFLPPLEHSLHHFLNLDTKLGPSLPLTWIPSLDSIPLFPPQSLTTLFPPFRLPPPQVGFKHPCFR